MRKMRKLYLRLFIITVLSLTSVSSMVYGAANDVKSYTYDSRGRLTFIDSRSERMSLQYDQQGNIISKYNEVDSNSLFGTPVVGAISDAVKTYSSTQGSGNWYYQQWDGNAYTDLQYKNNQWEGKTPYTIIRKEFQHPDQTDSVRKWVAPKSGMIRISGNVAKSDLGGGDGVIATILKNSTKLCSQTIAYNNTAGYELWETVEVRAGDAIYFIVNKNGDSAYDGTSWKSVISYVE